jgi:spermidine synthase
MVTKILQERGPVRMGVIGLGTGTMAAWGRPGDVIRFYEINPLVFKIAQTEFTFLRDSRATVDVVMGDARLSLEREPPQDYDLLAVDAFSSDSIPVHLVTREAFQVYFRHLTPAGVLAVHVSNRYLDLEPVVQRIATVLGKHARVVDSSDNESDGEFGSTWVLVTADAALFEHTSLSSATGIENAARIRLWTDDYSNLFQIVK